MIGRTYLESAIAFYEKRRVFRLPPSPVVVLQRWGRVDPEGKHIPTPGAPRNILIRRADISLTIRPFRGLRRP